MDETTEAEPSADPAGRANNDLLAAESTLEKLSSQMADEFQKHGESWPRDWMLKHIENRKVLIKARNIILDKIGG